MLASAHTSVKSSITSVAVIDSIKAKGFTLVELLIVITIIVIVTGALLPSFTGYIQNQNLKQSQEQLKSDLRTVQNKALTGSLSDELLGGTDPVNFWAIKFYDSNTYDSFVATSDTTCPGTFSADQFQNTDSISSDMTLKSDAGCMFFDIENGNITTSGGLGSPLIFGYSASNDSGDCRRIIYNSVGLIITNNVVDCP